MKLMVLIVNYNCELKNSESYLSIMNISFENYFSEYKIIIWDNLPYITNKEICMRSDKNINYVASSNNESLSVIYNKIIYENLEKFEYILLLDNDSKFDEHYIKEIINNIKTYNSIDLFVPVVKVNKRIVSPAKLYFFKGIEYKKINKYLVNSKNKGIINSGIVIKMEYFNKTRFKYDERMRFYLTDTYFIKKYAENRKKFVILNYALEHNLSIENKEELDKKLFRFNDFKRGLILLYSETRFKLFIIKMYIFFLSIKMSIRYKNRAFMKGDKLC